MPAPEHIGPYRIVQPLGRGGMGTVYLARDSRLNRRVALKLFAEERAHPDAGRQELLNEARAAAALNHPHIAAVHDVLEADGHVAIVFEYVDGVTLADRLQAGPLSVSETLNIGRQLADALAAAHQHGIVHRDLKPANVAITPDGVVKVLDFGVARVMPEGADNAAAARTTAAGFVGTVGYAAPEQCLGESVDGRADLFSLGVVLFEMLTGTRPFAGGDAATTVRSMLAGPPPRVRSLLPGIPEALDALISRTLAVSPQDRPADAATVRAVLSDLTGTARPAPAPDIRPTRRRVMAGIVIVVLMMAALVATLLRRGPQVPRRDIAPVVAVLPLTNASGESDKEYLSVGVADSLVTRLAALPSVTVLSRAAVAEARARLTHPLAIASELDATYVVDGTVQQAGDQLRISLSLVRRDASVAWADTVEGPFATIFQLQSRLAAALAQALAVHLSAAERASLAEQPTMNAEALAAYWRGRALLERRDVEGNLNAALAAFDGAIALDPRFADAHAGRGEALWARYLDTRAKADADGAIVAGTTALRLDPTRARVRYSLALSLAGSGQHDAALEELQHALALQPNFDEARAELGSVLGRQGRVVEAVAELHKAIALRPRFWRHHSALGLELFRAARYEEAAEAFVRVTELQPDNFIGYQQLGTVYQALGRDGEAIEQYRRATAIRPSAGAFSNIGTLHYRRGEFDNAAAAYREAIALRPNSHSTHGNLGDALRRLGRRAAAREAYREAARLAEVALVVNPKDLSAKAALAMYAAKAGDREQAARHLRDIQNVEQVAPGALVTAAVAYASLGALDASVAMLERAVALGYSLSEVIQTDEFDALRGLPKFEVLAAQPPSSGGPSQ
jgi:tetratricopeptide (TPR) repeat protein/TolB-like protein